LDDKYIPLETSFFRCQAALNSWHISVQQIADSLQIGFHADEIGFAGIILAFAASTTAHLTTVFVSIHS
jgi:hypothetical protein